MTLCLLQFLITHMPHQPGGVHELTCCCWVSMCWLLWMLHPEPVLCFWQAAGEPKTTIISYAPRKQPKTSKVGGKTGSAVIGAKAPLNGGLGKSGLIERSRARELAVKSQQEDAE